MAMASADSEKTLRLADQVNATFKAYDTDGNGHVTLAELKSLLTVLDPEKWTSESCERLLQSVDKNRNGTIEYTELVNGLFSSKLTEAGKSMLASDDVVQVRASLVEEERRRKELERKREAERQQAEIEAATQQQIQKAKLEWNWGMATQDGLFAKILAVCKKSDPTSTGKVPEGIVTDFLKDHAPAFFTDEYIPELLGGYRSSKDAPRLAAAPSDKPKSSDIHYQHSEGNFLQFLEAQRKLWLVQQEAKLKVSSGCAQMSEVVDDIDVAVMNLGGEEMCRMQVSRKGTVGMLKHEIENTLRISKRDQQLSHMNSTSVLRDEDSLSSIPGFEDPLLVTMTVVPHLLIPSKAYDEAHDEADAVLDVLDPRDFGEIKSMSKPPSGVGLVWSVVMHLMASIDPTVPVDAHGRVTDTSWKIALKMVNNPDKFFQGLKKFKKNVHAGIVPLQNVIAAREVVEDMGDEFSYATMLKKSQLAAGLVIWASGMISYCETVCEACRK